MIELLAKSLSENKEKIRVLLSKNDGIGFETYLKRTIRSLIILDAFKFRTQKKSDGFNFRTKTCPKLKTSEIFELMYTLILLLRASTVLSPFSSFLS